MAKHTLERQLTWNQVAIIASKQQMGKVFAAELTNEALAGFLLFMLHGDSDHKPLSYKDVVSTFFHPIYL